MFAVFFAIIGPADRFLMPRSALILCFDPILSEKMEHFIEWTGFLLEILCFAPILSEKMEHFIE